MNRFRYTFLLWLLVSTQLLRGQNVVITFQAWEIKDSDSEQWMNALMSDTKNLSTQIQQAASEKRITLSQMLVLQVFADTQTNLEEITERIYISDYEPPEIPHDDNKLSESQSSPAPDAWQKEVVKDYQTLRVTPTLTRTPTIFEPRNMGSSWKCFAAVENDNTVRLKIEGEIVRLQEITDYSMKVDGMQDPMGQIPIISAERFQHNLRLANGLWTPFTFSKKEKSQTRQIWMVRADLNTMGENPEAKDDTTK
jgi:hypothetical protein